MTADTPTPERAVVAMEALHPELRSRVAAATGNADVRVIEQLRLADQPETYEIHAVAGDRVVCMSLFLRSDGSVAETTRTFLRSEVAAVRVDDHGGAVVEVDGSEGRQSIPVPAAIARALRPAGADDLDDQESEPDFEASVKGVGQGIVGKVKEFAGELLDDPKLERKGILDQFKGRMRRSRSKRQPGPPSDSGGS